MGLSRGSLGRLDHLVEEYNEIFEKDQASLELDDVKEKIVQLMSEGKAVYEDWHHLWVYVVGESPLEEIARKERNRLLQQGDEGNGEEE